MRWGSSSDCLGRSINMPTMSPTPTSTAMPTPTSAAVEIERCLPQEAPIRAFFELLFVRFRRTTDVAFPLHLASATDDRARALFTEYESREAHRA